MLTLGMSKVPRTTKAASAAFLFAGSRRMRAT
jgi:hypothetical protein